MGSGVPDCPGADAIQAVNDEALFQLSCQVRPVPTPPTDILPLLLGITIPARGHEVTGRVLFGSGDVLR